jgi:hypothetical protein
MSFNSSFGPNSSLRGRVFGDLDQIVQATSEEIKCKIQEQFGQSELEEELPLKEVTAELTSIYRDLCQPKAVISQLLERIKKLNDQAPFSTSATKVANIIAWLVKREVVLAPVNMFVKKAIVLLLEHKRFESGWLQDLLPEKLVFSGVDRIYKCLCDFTVEFCSAEIVATAKKIAFINHKLAFVDDRECKLTRAEKLSLSFFAGVTGGQSNGHCKKSFYQLPRSLQYGKDRVYILLKDSVEGFTNKSTYKKVTLAIQLALTPGEEIEFMAQAVNLDESDYGVRLMERDLAYHRMVYDTAHAGIWPVSDSCLYSKEEGCKISIILPWGKSLHGHIIHDVGVVEQLCFGLDAIHQAGLLHWDIKAENVLYREIKKDLEVGIIDFGLCFKEGSKSGGYYLLNNGYYGTVTETAPELFGQGSFTGDCKKVEIWAFGCMIFQLVFGCMPKWDATLEKYYKASIDDSEENKGAIFVVDPKDQESFKKDVEESIEEPRRLLLQKKFLSSQEEFTLFIYDLLRLDPDVRLTSQEALFRIQAIKKKIMV